MKITLRGNPTTKKNSRRYAERGGKRILLPSAAFEKYQEACLWQIGGKYIGKIRGPVRVKYTYHMSTERSADLDNLVVATNDILVAAKVLEDDGRKYIRGIMADFGETDRKDPRVEIEIEEEISE